MRLPCGCEADSRPMASRKGYSEKIIHRRGYVINTAVTYQFCTAIQKGVNIMRSAKESGCFPYSSKRVCYIEVFPDGTVKQVSSDQEKRDAFENVLCQKSRLLAVWPGQWRSDLFVIDDLESFVEENRLFD